MPAYATGDDLAAYTAATPPTGQELTRLLDAASRDLDTIVGPWPVNPATGLKFLASSSPVTYITGLEPWQIDALKRATCAQAEYRLHVGEEFMVKDQHDVVSGPDIKVSGRLSYIGPKVWRELQDKRLLKQSVIF